MKARKIDSVETVEQTGTIGDTATQPGPVLPDFPEPGDTDELSREAMDRALAEYRKGDTFATKRLRKAKPAPDPRYTEQAILDRELLGLKKFYS